MIKNFIHISLALVVFLSMGGFWTNTHYCKSEGTVNSIILIFGSCCSSDSSCSSEEKSCGTHEEDDGCCHNILKFYNLDLNLILTKTEVKSFSNLPTLHAVPISNWQVSLITENLIKFYIYIPPLIVLDYQVRLQTFLC